MSARELEVADVWDRLPRDQRERLVRLVDDPPRAELLVSLLHNMAATINEIERDAARADAGELDDDEEGHVIDEEQEL